MGVFDGHNGSECHGLYYVAAHSGTAVAVANAVQRRVIVVCLIYARSPWVLRLLS